MGTGARVRLPFSDREEAGTLLAERLGELDFAHPIVLALPRGGVAVAVPVAERLHCPLDVLVIRKIGYPGQPELGVGAMAEGGEPVFDRMMLSRLGLVQEDMAPVVERERRELARRVKVYRAGRPPVEVAGKDVIVVDDGLATGGTARAALRAIRARGPRTLTLAVPVGAAATVRSLEAEIADGTVIVLATPLDFHSVGQWYVEFEQLTDADVLRLLGR
ncbi:MAG TPA: phosphoribosyltransferase family protein [Thermopolyspora sp.]